MDIGEYRSVRADNFETLDERVNKLLAEGFELYGNPYITESEHEFLVCQPMVKEKAGKAGMVPLSGI